MIQTIPIFETFLWLGTILILQMSVFLLIRRHAPVFSLPLSFSLSILGFTFISWYLGSLGLPPVLSFGIIIICGICGIIKNHSHILADLSAGKRYYALFILVFLAMLAVRLYSPDINGAEKFMDHAFIASIMRNPLVPPLDPWFAGGNLNVYYYMGHWMLAITGLVAGVPSYISFNLALPTIAAISAVNIFGAGNLLMKRFSLLPVIAFFMINPAFLIGFLSGTDKTMLLWNSTRIIPDTINEYPLFSFLFGDVHAHVIGLIPQTALILIVAATICHYKDLSNAGKAVTIISGGIFLAAVPVINSWDILIWAPFILITGLYLFIKSIRTIPGKSSEYKFNPKIFNLKGIFQKVQSTPESVDYLLWLLCIPVLSLLIAGPVLLAMVTQGIEGVGIVHSPSPPEYFLQVHCFFLLLLALSLRQEIRRYPWVVAVGVPAVLLGYTSAGLIFILLCWVLTRRRDGADLLAAGGLTILFLVEIFYLIDNMGETYYRMNTVFKLYIGAWILLGTGTAIMAGNDLSGRSTARVSKVGEILALCLLLFLLIAPPILAVTVAGPHTPTLNGMTWLEKQHPGDAEALDYLRAMNGSHVIVEAEGGDYQYHGRISSMTGIPTVIGWPFHEYMWRGDQPSGWYGKRISDVKAIYQNPEKTIPLMEDYGADLLYVGPTERETYAVSLPEKELIELYQQNEVTIYARNSL